MTSTFADLGLPGALVRELSNRGITEPFPIQDATIPDALAGRDVSGKAPTGSGKTLAFGLPMLINVENAKPHKPRALVLAPTRELAEQIKKDLAPLAKTLNRSVTSIFGGVRYEPQIRSLRNGVEIVIATPGRLEDLIEQKAIDLSLVSIVAIDEADRMADMGFLPAVQRILNLTARDRQTLLFSATLDGDVAVLIRKYQTDPVRHEAASIEPETSEAQHFFWLVDHEEKVRHAAHLVDSASRTIVFTRTRHGADRLARQLSKYGVEAVAMHGGRSQNQRQRALRSFDKGHAQALIATDVAARGIHVDSVASVVHFDPPADHKDYVHRSGRTARAGASGTVYSLVTGEQRRTVRRMQQQLDIHDPIERPKAIAFREPSARPDTNDRDRKPQASKTETRHRKEKPARQSRDQGVQEGQRRESASRPDAPQGKNANAARTLHVSNLPWSTTDDDVRRLFAKHTRVRHATVMMDRRGRSKGYAIVELTQPDAGKVVKILNGSRLRGRPLKVRIAERKLSSSQKRRR